LFAMTAKRWELVGNSVLRSVITLSSQMKARDQLPRAALRVLSASHRLAFIVDAECDPV